MSNNDVVMVSNQERLSQLQLVLKSLQSKKDWVELDTRSKIKAMEEEVQRRVDLEFQKILSQEPENVVM